MKWRKLPNRPLMAAALTIITATGLFSAFAGEPEQPPVTVASTDSARPAEGARRPAEGYQLGPGDRIRITVYEEQDLSGTFEVAGDRTLSLPLIGEVPVGGLTVRQLEAAVEHRLRDGFLKQPRVSAEVVNYRPFFIIGEVNRPGGYAYVNNMTVVNAVALGGGYTYRARTSKAFLTRAADPERREEAVTPDTVIMPGDVIRVPERYF